MTHFKVTTREDVEEHLVLMLVADLVSAGYVLELNDYPDGHVRFTAEQAPSVLFKSDEDIIHVYSPFGAHIGWVRCFYGNGWAVVSDYTTNLEGILARSNQEASDIMVQYEGSLPVRRTP